MTIKASKKLSFEGVHKVNGQEYLLSTNPAYLDHKRINAALNDPDMFWAHSLSEANLETMLDNSLCLGLYKLHTQNDQGHADPSNREQVGLARLITDHVTFAWLTDVYVLSDHRGQGLGKWMIEALEEMFSGMPELRRAMLVAEMDGMGPQYQRLMGCTVWENGRGVILQRLGPAGGTLGVEEG